MSAGIQLQIVNVSGSISNNTVYKCCLGVTGYLDRVAMINNLAQKCERGYFPWNQLSSRNDYNLSDRVEWDLNAVHSRDTVTVIFSDAGSGDFHLSPADTVARDHGTLYPAAGLFGDDIDGQAARGALGYRCRRGSLT